MGTDAQSAGTAYGLKKRKGGVATPKGRPKLSMSQQAQTVSTITTLAGCFQGRVWPEGPGSGEPATLGELKRHYRLAGIDPRIIRIAEQLCRSGGTAVGPYGAQQAKELGIQVKGRWQVIGAKKKARG